MVCGSVRNHPACRNARRVRDQALSIKEGERMAIIITHWKCDNCGQENLGRTPDGKLQITSCGFCGAPIPEDPHYSVPDNPIEITDPKILADLKAGGSMWFCGYCSGANPTPGPDAEVVTCEHCGTKFRKSTFRNRKYDNENVPHSAEEVDAAQEAFGTAAEARAGRLAGKSHPDPQPSTFNDDSSRYQDHTHDAPPEAAGPTSYPPLNRPQPALRQRNQPVQSLSGQHLSRYNTKVMAVTGLAAIAILAILGLAVFGLISYFNRPPLTGHVTGFSWASQVNIWAPVEVSDGDWQDSVPSDAYDESCYSKATGQYEQKEEEYISGYEDKVVEYNYTVTEWESEPYTCTEIRGDGTADTNATCYHDVPHEVEKKGTRTEPDYSRPIYDSHMVDDLTRPIYDQWCDYHIIEQQIIRTPKNSGDGLQPLDPVYELGPTEYADDVVYTYYAHLTYKDKDGKEVTAIPEVKLDQAVEADLSKEYVIDKNILGQVTGYHESTEKDRKRMQ